MNLKTKEARLSTRRDLGRGYKRIGRIINNVILYSYYREYIGG